MRTRPSAGVDNDLLAQVPFRWLLGRAAAHGLAFREVVEVNETVDESVFDYWRANDGYRPKNLTEWEGRFSKDSADLNGAVRLRRDPRRSSIPLWHADLDSEMSAFRASAL